MNVRPSELLLWFPIVLPAAAGLACRFMPSGKWIFRAVLAVAAADAAAAAGLILKTASEGRIFAASGWLFLDALSAFHLAVMAAVTLFGSVYARMYFGREASEGRFPLDRARQFGGLWCGALAALALVLSSNNLGVMWVGIEATTLLTAFLICIHVTGESLEAMWKYLVVCSVGVAFAFMGTLLLASSAKRLGLEPMEMLLWTRLSENASAMDPLPVKAGFLFLLVGFGTKAGLAPMHNWLPDAHSQAPAPVSALFSGFLLSAAMYCLMRVLPLVEAATGRTGWAMHLLAGFGLLSILVAAAFIPFQKNVKRFLAYSSLEHMGVVAFGIGTGGIGAAAALFHTLNHSLAKSLAFFSAGRLGQDAGSHEMKNLGGSLRRNPLWGGGLCLAVLALAGAVPFALFMSEFQILKAAVDAGPVLPVVLFLTGLAVVFIGALGHVIGIAWGEGSAPSGGPPSVPRPKAAERALVVLLLVLLAGLGLWMPGPLRRGLKSAASVVTGGPSAAGPWSAPNGGPRK
jgi:hydrogenase-4 component F